jgi:hypothetical protein
MAAMAALLKVVFIFWRLRDVENENMVEATSLVVWSIGVASFNDNGD